MCKDVAKLGGSTSVQNQLLQRNKSYTLHGPLCSSGSNGVNGWIFLLPSCGRSLGDLD